MINITRRDFPRISYKMKIAYEIVKWNAEPLRFIEKPCFAYSHDLSVSGIGLYTLPDIDKKTQKRLTSGKDKIRLALYLKGESDPYPLVLFARLVWSKEEIDAIRCGFIFTDIMPEQYTIINAIINEKLRQKEELG